MNESNGRVYAYEGMFLVNQQVATDLNAAAEHITGILDRAGASLLALRKWDDRRLAYEIKNQRRGVYFLAYFRSDPQKLTQIERDCNLSEIVMRSMVTRADHLTEEEMLAADRQEEIATEAKLREAESAPAKATAES